MCRITAFGEAIGRAGNGLFIGAVALFIAFIFCHILQRPVQDKLSGTVDGHDIGRGAPIPLRFAELFVGETEIQLGAARQFFGDRHGAPEFTYAPGVLRFLECAAGN